MPRTRRRDSRHCRLSGAAEMELRPGPAEECHGERLIFFQIARQPVAPISHGRVKCDDHGERLPGTTMNKEKLFHDALAPLNLQARAAFLDEACAGQPELRAEIEALLAAHDDSGELP